MQPKIKIAIFFLLITQVAFAGSMEIEPSCGIENSPPCSGTAWDFGGRALYLQVKYANDPWLTGQSIIHNITQTQTEPVVLENFGWGLFLEGSYHFGSDRAFTGNLYYLDNHDQIEGVMPNHGFRNFTQKTQWIAVNLEVSQVLPVSDSNGIRGYVGFQYANITKQQSFYRLIEPPLSNDVNKIFAVNNASFYGAGPRLGVDLTYHLPCHWISGVSVYTNAAFEVLIGESKSRSFVQTAPVDTLRNIGVWESVLSVVPELDIRVGANYKYTTHVGQLNFDLGAMWLEYASPMIERVIVETADVTIQGVYCGLKWVGHFA